MTSFINKIHKDFRKHLVILKMKKKDKITMIGKMMLKDKIIGSWDRFLTEKPQGRLAGFLQKRLEHFCSANLEKIIGKERYCKCI